jgi:hypothetical protein
MVILHGWINIRKGDNKILGILEDLNESKGIQLSKMYMNGEVVYNFFLCHNHMGQSIAELFESLKQIVDIENPDTYGLIYMLNDEDPVLFDQWQIWRITKNKIVEIWDEKYLSPYSEKIAWYPND